MACSFQSLPKSARDYAQPFFRETRKSFPEVFMIRSLKAVEGEIGKKYSVMLLMVAKDIIML